MFGSEIIHARTEPEAAKTFSHPLCLKDLRDLKCFFQFSVQFSRSVVSNSATPWTAACQASLSITNSWRLLKFMSTESVMPSNHLILCCPLLLPPSIFPSIRVFSSESVLCIRWPKYWSFSFTISPSNEYSGLISFRMDWVDLLAVRGTLKSLLQHHSSKASILQRFQFHSGENLVKPNDQWGASPLAQTVNNPPAMQETRVQSLGQKDPLEKGTATHSSILPGETQGQRSLAGYSPWGRTELDMSEHRMTNGVHQRAL